MLGNRLLEAVLVLQIVGPPSHFPAEWPDGLYPITPKSVHHEVYGPFPGDGGLAFFPIVVWHLEGWAVFFTQCLINRFTLTTSGSYLPEAR